MTAIFNCGSSCTNNAIIRTYSSIRGVDYLHIWTTKTTDTNVNNMMTTMDINNTTSPFMVNTSESHGFSYNNHHFNHTITGERGPYHVTQQVLDRYFTTGICILGCIGNFVNLFVLVRMRRRQIDGGRENVANIGLISLAISDMLFCITLFPRGFFSTQRAFFPHGFQLYYQVYGTWLVTTFILTSTWITVAMAALRYLAICHPLYSRRFDGATFAKVSYGTVFISAVIFNLPSFWQYQILEFTDDLYLIDIGHIDLSKTAGKAYQWIRAIFGIFVPALILVFCNLSLITALRKSYRMRREFHVQDLCLMVRNRVTAILVIIATTFIVLVFPSELLDFFSTLFSKDSSNAGFLIRSITNLLQVMNFSFNFVLYCALNVHFRTVLKEFVCNVHMNKFVSRTNSHSGDAASDFERQWLQYAKTGLSIKTSISQTRM